mgnify:CR=1 FL=1
MQKKIIKIPEIKSVEKKEIYDISLLNHSLQQKIIYDDDDIFKNIKNKLSAYKQQDKKNEMLNEEKFIDMEDVKELLKASNLYCYYCRKEVYILYNTSKQGNQWTLDRIDNNLGHNKDNCVVSCLKCNLDRGRIDSKKFYFTKRMVIKKQ